MRLVDYTRLIVSRWDGTGQLGALAATIDGSEVAGNVPQTAVVVVRRLACRLLRLLV